MREFQDRERYLAEVKVPNKLNLLVITMYDTP